MENPEWVSVVGPNIVPPEDNSATALTETLLAVGAAICQKNQPVHKKSMVVLSCRVLSPTTCRGSHIRESKATAQIRQPRSKTSMGLVLHLTPPISVSATIIRTSQFHNFLTYGSNLDLRSLDGREKSALQAYRFHRKQKAKGQPPVSYLVISTNKLSKKPCFPHG